VNLDADRVAELAARPLSELTRRDVALALLTVPSADALGSLPGIRRGLLAAGNPLSAVFWSSAEAILHKINDSDATVGDVRTWLEATGTEPNGIIGLHVWDDQSERSQLAAEMHTRLVSHLEDQLAADDDEDNYDLGDLDDDEFDELGMEGLFLPVTSLWQVLGAIDDEDCLTPLGWWGLPEAMLRVWAPTGGAQN
jgi:hypothetical protein